ncbi:DUF3310 domain-containing protein [Endozoicomonas ascidiicola]|uniref:DUF3310 domain-containing protein n=1 Tax=Endozoicomonas ascidiicola TaxID=1698521 RepID=UPI000A4EDDF5|nr:DUF3310 domain-containing protein [Endozoicomonas ascidiicola]
MDNVTHPNHYAGQADPLLIKVRGIFVTDCDSVNIECIQAMVNQMDSVDEIRGYLRGNAFKYQWRYRNKNGLEDLKKAKVYLNWQIDLEKAVSDYCQLSSVIGT